MGPLAQQVDPLNDAILAVWKALYAMIARRTQRLSACVALDDRHILTMI
jgi:hypothetical protein